MTVLGPARLGKGFLSCGVSREPANLPSGAIVLSLLHSHGCVCYPSFADIPIEMISVCCISCRLGYLGLESCLQVATSGHAEFTPLLVVVTNVHWFCWSP